METGGRYDATWLAAELGQPDLCTPPPPPRLESSGAHGPALGAPLVPGGERENLILARPLPLHLDADEVLSRMDKIVDVYATPQEAAEQALKAGCTWLEDVDGILEGSLSEADFSAITIALMQAWFVMVPLGHYAPEVPFKKFRNVLSATPKPLFAAPMTRR